MERELHPDRYPPVWQVIVIILLTTFFIVILGVLAFLLGAKKEILLLEALLILPALILILTRDYPPKVVFRLRPVNLKMILISIVIAFAFTIIFDELDRIFQLLLPMPEILRLALEQSLKIQSRSDLIIVVFSGVFLAAIIEEMLFRGFLQTSFEKHIGVKKAIVLSAIIFSLIHGNPWWLFQIILIGILLGVMAWKSNSIIPSAIVHFINNGISIAFLNMKTEHYQWYLHNGHVSIPILTAAIVIAIFGMIMFFQFCKPGSMESR